MSKGIHASSSGNFLGHANGQLWVTDDDGGENLWVEDDLLLLSGCICQHAGTPDLGACSRRGGHCNDRFDAIRIRASPPVSNIFKIPNWSSLSNHEGDQFGQVQPRSTTKGDYSIKTTFPKDP